MRDHETVDVNSIEFSKYALCPWCGRGRTMADDTAGIHVSAQCPRCGRLYVIDCQTMRTFRFYENSKTYRQKR